ncbi:MAG TPA: replicative DNA helicase [Candidatus Binatia bacterium]|jgi:replicative DNA helicase|nr:replicative DNA helicase [Candidatus Binatia bacterium]
MPAERVPPQNLEAEQSLIGALLIEKDALLRVADMVRTEDFYRQAHAEIFQAVLELSERKEPIDLLSLGNRLSDKGKLEAVGGRAYLIELTTIVPTAAHVVHYAQIVQKKATLRRLLSASSEIVGMAFDEAEDIDDVLDRAEQKLFGVSQNYLKTNFTPIKDALDNAFERIDELHRERGKLRGIPTGFHDLDNLLGGLQRSDLVILAARPSVGKTSFAMDIARQSAVKYKVPVGIFSLEMSKEQLVDRMICAEAGVDLWKMRTGKLTDSGTEHSDFARIGHALGNLSEAPIYIDDTANLTITEIRTKARRLQLDRGLGLLVIDYLQLMESRSGNKNSDNRVQEVAEITRALKGLARELNIPVLALSQLSRTTELSKPAIPKLSHLRESGSIEQDADIVMFIYRKAADRNYRLDEIPLEEQHLAEIHVAKHRNGPVGQVTLFFDADRASFRNLDKRANQLMAAAGAPAAQAKEAPVPQF